MATQFSQITADAWNWLNFWLAVAGLVLTILGFGIALWQIMKTKSAAEAAAQANTVGTKRIRYNQLLILQPQLAQLEPEMDSAVSRNDRFAAERALVRWRQVATQAASILRELDEQKHMAVVTLLDKTCGAARNAKARLPEVGNVDDGKTVMSVTAAVRKDMATCSDSLGGIVSNLSTDVDGGASNE